MSIPRRQTADDLDLAGFGIASIPGFQDTPGKWSFRTQAPGAPGGGQVFFSFSASSAAEAAVPEPSTVAMLGAGLVALGFRARRLLI